MRTLAPCLPVIAMFATTIVLPVAYTRNTPMTIQAFEPWYDSGQAPTGGPNPGPSGLVYRAIHDPGGSNETIFKGSDAMPAVATRNLPDHIHREPAYHLEWDVSFDQEATWFPIGNTSHEVYVTLNNPDPATLMAESVFRIGCNSAVGADNIMSAWIGIIGEFADRDVRTAPLNVRMGYYANGENDNTQVTRASDLLLDPYNGQCGAWGELLVHCLWLHGLDAHLISVLADPDELPEDCGIVDVPIFMLIKNYWFGGVATSGCTFWPYRIDIPALSLDAWPATTTECLATFGAPGQNSYNPPSAFSLHYIVRLEPSPGLQLFFDPSYGNGPFLNEDDWQMSSIAGFARRIITAAMPGQEPVGARPSIGSGGIKFVE